MAKSGMMIFLLKNALSKSRIERRTPLIDNAHTKITVSHIAVAISRLFSASIIFIFIYGQPANGWCEPRRPARAGKTRLKSRHLRRRNHVVKAARVGVGCNPLVRPVRPKPSSRTGDGRQRSFDFATVYSRRCDVPTEVYTETEKHQPRPPQCRGVSAILRRATGPQSSEARMERR